MSAKLSTHVLDTAHGCPAKGMRLELRNLDSGELLVSATTNQDGRTEEPLLDAKTMKVGHYELLFFVGDYFKTRETKVSSPPFLDLVPVRFAIADASLGYHVPLLVSPWSYTTYCGS